MEPGSSSPESQLIGAPARTRPDLAAKANPIPYMHEGVPPCLILHGRRDELQLPAARASCCRKTLVATRQSEGDALLDQTVSVTGFSTTVRSTIRDPYEMSVCSSAEDPLAAPTIRQNYVFPLIEAFFRATL